MREGARERGREWGNVHALINIFNPMTLKVKVYQQIFLVNLAAPFQMFIVYT